MRVERSAAIYASSIFREICLRRCWEEVERDLVVVVAGLMAMLVLVIICSLTFRRGPQMSGYRSAVLQIFTVGPIASRIQSRKSSHTMWRALRTMKLDVR